MTRALLAVIAGFVLAVVIGRAQPPQAPAGQQGRGRGMQFTEPSPTKVSVRNVWVKKLS